MFSAIESSLIGRFSRKLVQKPDCLPLKKKQDILDFESIDDFSYEKVS